ncbi:MAG: Gfo/Idh/MocA family oxidoreductase, partial [bacterium]
KALADGMIGKLQSLHQERLNLGKARDVENAAWSLGVHDVAVALYLFGEAPTASTMSGKATFTAGVEDDTYIHMTFGRGAVAHIHSSWLWPELRRRLTLIGDKGMLVFDEPSKQVVLYKKSIDDKLNNVDEGQEVVYEGAAQPLTLELEHFIECAQSGKTPDSDGQSGVDVLKVLAGASK